MQHKVLLVATGLVALLAIAAKPEPSVNMAVKWDELNMLRAGLDREMHSTLQRISECSQRNDTGCAEAGIYYYTSVKALRTRVLQSFEPLRAEYERLPQEP